MLTGNVQSASRKGSAIRVMNWDRIGILGVLDISLDKKGCCSVRIANNIGLEKGSLIQYKTIS